MFYVAIANVVWSQGLHVSSGEEFYVSPGNHVYVGGEIDVDASGTPGKLIVSSNATTSGSIIVEGNSPSGNITYQRYIDDTKWHLVAPPVVAVAGYTIPNFVADAANAVNVKDTDKYAVSYYKNTNLAGNRWVYHKTSADGSVPNEEALTAFTNGMGYSMNRTSAGLFSFKGLMPTANVTVPLVTAAPSTHYWHAVGNPYPSFLPVNDDANVVNVVDQNLAVFDTEFAGLYIWDANLNGGEYTLINKAYSGAVYLAPGQAFLVNTKDNNESFIFSEALQSHQNGADTFYRTSQAPSIVVKLSNGKRNKTTTLKYFSSATTGLDIGYDGGAYQDGSPSFSLDTHLVSNSQGTDFTLQCLPLDAYETLVVPLSVRAAANQELSFTVNTTSLPTGVSVYLEDKVKNSIHNISDAAYSFTPSTPLNGVGRFYIHTSQKSLSVADVNGLAKVNIYKTSNNILKIIGLENANKSRVKVYSITGKEVLSKNITAKNVNNIQLPKLSAGVYIVKVDSDVKQHTKKIIIE